MNKKQKILPGGVMTQKDTSLVNKTSSWRTQKPIWLPEKCIHDLLCVHFCPEKAIKAKKDKMQGFDYTYCKGCGICEEICPVKPKAIKMEEEK